MSTPEERIRKALQRKGPLPTSGPRAPLFFITDERYAEIMQAADTGLPTHEDCEAGVCPEDQGYCDCED